MHIIAVDDERLALVVCSFRDPVKALEHLRDHSCDVAFLDIKMRGMTGLELARRVKELRSGTNIVFVTGYSEFALDAFHLYASGYLLKRRRLRSPCSICEPPLYQSRTIVSASNASATSRSLPAGSLSPLNVAKQRNFWRILWTAWVPVSPWVS